MSLRDLAVNNCVTQFWFLSLEIFAPPPGALVKHAFSRIGKRTFSSCLDVSARLATLSGFLERTGSSDCSPQLVRDGLFRGYDHALLRSL